RPRHPAPVRADRFNYFLIDPPVAEGEIPWMRLATNVGDELAGELVPVALRMVDFVGQAVADGQRDRQFFPGWPVGLEVHRALHECAVDMQRSLLSVKCVVVAVPPETQRR